MELAAPQCRAARALLNWSQGELGQKARVDQKTIADFERGARQPHPRTIEALVSAFEVAGIVFIEGNDSIYNGVALKMGTELRERQQGGASDTTEGNGGLKALSWEDDVEEAAEPTPEQIELREHWRNNPEQWARFHESSRQVILGMMGLRRL